MGGMLDYLNDEEENYFSNPLKTARNLGLVDTYDTSSPLDQRNYLDDTFGTFAGKLPIDEPSGSVVSGGREDLYHKYSQMLEQESGSKSILDDYLGRRPTTEQYKPSTGRKILAGLVGLGSAFGREGSPVKGYAATEGILRQPFHEAMNQYQDEGKFIDDEMRLADSSKNQQLQGMLNQIRQQELNNYRQSQIQNRQDSLRGQQSRLDQQEADKKADREYRDRVFQSNQANKDREFNATQTYRKEILRLRSLGDANKPENTMITPKRDDVKSALQNKIYTDSEARKLFDLESGQPIWISESRDPTPDEFNKYQILMRSVEQGNLPSIESLGFGE